MEMSNTLRFSVATCDIFVDTELNLVIQDFAKSVLFCEELKDTPFELRIVEQDGTFFLEISSDLDGGFDEKETFRPPVGYRHFQVLASGGGLGVGDLRDLKTGPKGFLWNLITAPIQLFSDGIYLTVLFKSSENSNVPQAYEVLSWESTQELLGEIAPMN